MITIQFYVAYHAFCTREAPICQDGLPPFLYSRYFLLTCRQRFYVLETVLRVLFQGLFLSVATKVGASCGQV